MKKSSISRFFPPGREYRTELGLIAAFGIVVLVINIEAVYVSQFYNHLRSIERFHEMDSLWSFNYYIEGACGWYWFFLLICIVWAVLLRWYFSHNRSIYIMKRLDSVKELFLRTAAMPLAMAVTGFVICIIAVLLMHLHYNTAAPEYALQGEPIKLWRAFIPRGLLNIMMSFGWIR